MYRYKGRDRDENEPVGGWNIDGSIIYIYKNLDELPDTGHA